MEPLLVDASPWSSIKPEDWARLSAAGPPWAGVVLKGGQGGRDCGTWVRRHGAAVRAARLPLGLYWYLHVYESGRRQADRLCDLLAELRPSLLPVVDVEEGSGNAEAARLGGPALVERETRAFVDRVRERTGLPTVLYAGGWLRGLGLRSLLGCDLLWLAAYTATLPRAWYERDLGCPPDRLWAWQYMGFDGRRVLCELAGYPRTTPVGSSCDISAVVLADGLHRAGVAEAPPATAG